MNPQCEGRIPKVCIRCVRTAPLARRHGAVQKAFGRQAERADQVRAERRLGQTSPPSGRPDRKVRRESSCAPNQEGKEKSGEAAQTRSQTASQTADRG